MTRSSLALRTVAGALLAVFGLESAHAQAGNPLPRRDRPELPNSELVLTLSLELSNEPDNPSAVAGRAVRTNWRVVGDVAETQARVSHLRSELMAKYVAPTTLGRFSLVSNEVQASRIRQYLTAETLFGFKEAMYRNLWLAESPIGVWGAGWGAEYVRLDAVEGVAPFLVSYVARQGESTTAVPLVFYWALDRRVPNVLLPAGHLSSLVGEWGTPGGRIEYVRVDAKHQSHFPLGSRASVGVNLGFGRVVGLENDLSPYNKRFLGGGVGSVRGYEPGALSPRDVSGAAIGADSKVTASAEGLLHAIDVGATPIIVSVFYDYGQFTRAYEAVGPEAKVTSYGLGLSLPMRWGLMRVYYSWPQDKEFRTQEFQFEARASW